jgi:hypothetical protein
MLTGRKTALSKKKEITMSLKTNFGEGPLSHIRPKVDDGFDLYLKIRKLFFSNRDPVIYEMLKSAYPWANHHPLSPPLLIIDFLKANTPPEYLLTDLGLCQIGLQLFNEVRLSRIFFTSFQHSETPVSLEQLPGHIKICLEDPINESLQQELIEWLSSQNPRYREAVYLFSKADLFTLSKNFARIASLYTLFLGCLEQLAKTTEASLEDTLNKLVPELPFTQELFVDSLLHHGSSKKATQQAPTRFPEGVSPHKKV